MEEEWRDIKGYEGYYQVSNCGRVRSLPRIVIGKDGRFFHVKGGIQSKNNNGHGYDTVYLRKDSQAKRFYVHRLVAEAFLPNPHNLEEVNHKNEIRNDNRLENLEWISVRDNRLYGERMRRIREPQSIPVKQYDAEGNYIQSFCSIKEASRQTGISDTSIGNCVNGYLMTAGGFIWTTSKNHEVVLPDNKHYKSVDQYDSYGNFICTFNTIRSAFKSAKTTFVGITDSCNTPGKKAGGYYWTWHDAPFEHPIITIKCFNPKTNELVREFTDYKSAAEFVGTLPSEIKRCCNGRCKTVKGFAWEYCEEYLSQQGD